MPHVSLGCVHWVKRLLKLGVGLCLLVFSSVLPGEQHDTLLLSGQSDHFPAAGYIHFLEDPEAEFTFAEAQSAFVKGLFTVAGKRVPSFGATKSAYWFRLSIKNVHKQQTTWWFEVQDPVLDNVDVYFMRSGVGIEHHSLGDHQPLHERQIKIRNPTIPFSLSYDEEVEVFLRVRTFGTLSAPLTVWKPEGYPQYNARQQLGYGLFYGTILALLLYNLMLFLSIRDYNYLYYCMFVGTNALYLFCTNGLAYEYFWPSNGEINITVAVTLGNISTVFMVVFANSFLRGRETFPLLRRFMQVVIASAIFPLILLYSGKETLAVLTNTLFSLTAISLIFIAGLMAYAKGVREAKYFLLAWVALLAGIFVLDMTLNGVLPATFITIHGIQIGAALETVLLSFALAHKMRLLMEENDRIQTEAKETLEQNVKDRTEELSIAMKDLAKANEQLKESSSYDSLTGIRNRSYLEEEYQREWLRARRDGNSLAVLMLDIDHFKVINDTYGHLCGDHALRILANLMNDVVHRPGDIVARYGGEEFMIVLPGTTLEGARFLADRIRRDLEKQLVKFNDIKFKLTVSIGCAAIVPSEDNLNPESLVDAADKALYVAKERGRNRVHAIS